MRKLALSDEILLNIEKPARYIGGEVNSVMKDKDKVDVRFAMCFSGTCMRLVCLIWGSRSCMICLTAGKDTWCERVYSPWTDLDKVMRDQKIPLFALESQDPVKKFDFLGHYHPVLRCCYTNILQILELSHIPLHAAERTDADPVVIGGGDRVPINPEPLADFFDIFYIGEGEDRL